MKQKVLHVLIALAVAFGIWTYVVTVVSPESEATFHNVSVELINPEVLSDRGLMVISEKPTVTLRLRGNRNDLSALKNSDITIIANLAKIYSEGEQTLDCSVSFGSNAFEVLDQNPMQITVQIARWDTKEVPVVPVFTGVVGAGYRDFREDATFRESITITGPKDVVDRITQARFQVDLTGKKETFSESYTYTLCDSSGEAVNDALVKKNTSEIGLTLRILPYKVVQLQVTPQYGNGLTEQNTVITQNRETIEVAGSETLLAKVPSVWVIDDLDLSTWTQSGTHVVPLDEFFQTWSDLVNVDEEFKELEIGVLLPERKTKTLTVSTSQIRINGLPEGWMLKYHGTTVDIQLEGWADRVDAITAEDLILQANITSVREGTQELELHVGTSQGFADVSVTVMQSLTVELSKVISDIGGFL